MKRTIEWEGPWKRILKSGSIYAAPYYRRRLILCKHCKSYLTVVVQKTYSAVWYWEITRQAPPKEAHDGYDELETGYEPRFREAKYTAEKAAEKMVIGVD